MFKATFESVRIARKLQILVNVVGFVMALSIGTLGYIQAHDAILAEVGQKVESVLNDRHETMREWFKAIRGDVLVQAQNPLTLQALHAYQQAWDTMEGGQTESLQKLYIDDNPNPVGKKEDLDYAKDGSSYSRAHAYFHPYFRTFLRDRSYYDVFIFDARGNCLYTVFKERDFATNVVDGKWKDSDLGKVFRDARDNAKPGYVAFTDFAPYAPSNDVPASFIASPIFDQGKFAGVIAFQMPIGTLNEIMQRADGLGKTGETFLVGADYLMRSDSRFTEKGTTDILKTKVDFDFVKKALAGDSGSAIVETKPGVMSDVQYSPLDVEGDTRWVVVVTQDTSEIFAPVYKYRNDLIMLTLVGMIVLGLIGLFVGRSFSRPIVGITERMKSLAAGDTAATIPYASRKDEIGDMATALQVFKENIVETENMRKAREDDEKRAAEDRRKEMMGIADDFQSKVGGIVEAVAAASTEMNASSASLSSVADDTSSRSAGVSAAAEETSANVSTVASATDELSASIADVTKQISDTVALARDAEVQAESTNATVERLNSAASKIGDVVALIQEIAEQTNLLALNATIEAARAGEAGKGFAVVATEVKNLAGQTGKATEEIAEQVGEIQTVARGAVDAISVIRNSIQKINQRIAAVSAAAEEQSATTLEIARNVQEASRGTQEVSSNIATVSQSSSETRSMAGDVNAAARELSKQAETLKHEINLFLAQVRSG